MSRYYVQVKRTLGSLSLFDYPPKQHKMHLAYLGITGKLVTAFNLWL